MKAIKHLSASNIRMLTYKGATLTDPLHIDNIFNDYLVQSQEKLKSISSFQINHFEIFCIILIRSRYS